MRNTMSYRNQERLRKQRENPETSRHGLKWDDDEDTSLLDKINQGLSVEDVAKEFKRTAGAIKTRLIVKALTYIDEHSDKSIEDAADEYGITVQDIQEYQVNQKKRTERNNNYRLASNNKAVTLSTFYTQVMRRLDQIDSKLG